MIPLYIVYMGEYLINQGLVSGTVHVAMTTPKWRKMTHDIDMASFTMRHFE